MLQSSPRKKTARRLWIRGALIGVPLLITALGAFAYANRIPIADWGLTQFLESRNIRASYLIETLNWNEILITNINIENGILIPKVHILRKSTSPQIANIESIHIQIDSIDVWTTKKVIEQLMVPAGETTSEPLGFADYAHYCYQLKPTTLKFRIEKIVHESTEIPLNLKLEHTPGSDKTEFRFSGENLDYTGNKKFQVSAQKYAGNMELECSADSIRLSGDPVTLTVKNLYSDSPRLTVKNSKITSEKVQLVLSRDNRARLHLPLELKLTALTATQKIVADIPKLLLTADHSLDSSQKSSLLVSGKKLHLSSPYGIKVANLQAELSTPYSWSESLDGQVNLSGLTILSALDQPLVQNLSSKIQLHKASGSSNAVLSISDATKNLAITDLQILQTNSAFAAEFQKKTTQVELNSRIVEVFPILKEYIQYISGKLRFGGLITYKNGELAGNIQAEGQDISADTAFGEVSKMNFSHDVVSLETLASSPGQRLTIKSFTAGKELRNLELNYQVLSKSHILARSLHVEHEGANIDAKNFSIDPVLKILKGFKATIEKLKLDTLLVLAAGPFISAEGTLSGEIALAYKDKIPTIDGQLQSDGPGWIRYRKQGDVQQKNISLSDNPMTILNGYLYNYQYQELDMELATDRKYKMTARLKALGRNPDYLGGKPLKLKINFEQNVLAAIQSMMLSYSLPNKLKEKIEKAGKEP